MRRETKKQASSLRVRRVHNETNENQKGSKSMTREEAILLLKQYQGYEPMDYGQKLRHAFDLTDETVDTLLSALRPVSRERVEKWRGEWVSTGVISCKCSKCNKLMLKSNAHEYNFCPYCMAPVTDEAVDMVMERWEAMKDG